MSLINDALKKAQRQRSTDSAPPLAAPPTAGPGPGARAVKRAKPLAFDVQMLRLALTVLGVGLVLVGGVLYFQWKAYPTGTLTLSGIKPRPKAPVKETPVSVEEKISLVVPATAPEAAATTAVEPSSPLVSAPAAPIEPAVAHPALKARPDPRILAFIDTVRITGIRASGADSKVLMNDRVFRVNDMVDRTLGLRLTAVEANALIFEDERGVVYTRNF